MRKKRLAPYIEKGWWPLSRITSVICRARLQEAGVQEIDGICYDLGVSSPQLDQRERGFSYKKDAPLDMRMNQEARLTAYEVVNHYDYHDLGSDLFKYGEDKFSKQIARKIEQAREMKPIETTTELAEIIKSAKPAKELKKRDTLPDFSGYPNRSQWWAGRCRWIYPAGHGHAGFGW